MAENLNLITGSKEVQYAALVPQIASLLAGETDLIANMANVCAALKQQFDFLWVGFYRVKNQDLVLGPFQGPVACTRIAYGKGVCGTSWQQKAVLIVPNVDEFEGHIACSSLSRSEIVLPVFVNDEVIGVLDIDSQNLNHFDKTDQKYLDQILSLITLAIA